MRIQLAGDFALIHDEDAVRKVHDLVQLQRYEKDGGPRVARGNDLPVDEFDRAHVKTARRLHGDEEAVAAVQLAR